MIPFSCTTDGNILIYEKDRIHVGIIFDHYFHEIDSCGMCTKSISQISKCEVRIYSSRLNLVLASTLLNYNKANAINRWLYDFITYLGIGAPELDFKANLNFMKYLDSCIQKIEDFETCGKYKLLFEGKI
jgi:hypothetical protein